MMGDFQTRNLQPKKNPISDDYRITGSVLGLGINGKVVECFSKTSNRKCALKVNVDIVDDNLLPYIYIVCVVLCCYQCSKSNRFDNHSLKFLIVQSSSLIHHTDAFPQ